MLTWSVEQISAVVQGNVHDSDSFSKRIAEFNPQLIGDVAVVFSVISEHILQINSVKN